MSSPLTTENDVVAKLEDLIKQATTERSHFYVATTAGEAIREINDLRTQLFNAHNSRPICNCLHCKMHRARYGMAAR